MSSSPYPVRNGTLAYIATFTIIILIAWLSQKMKFHTFLTTFVRKNNYFWLFLLIFDHFWVFFMIFVIFVDLRCVQQAEFTIRRDRKKSCFWQILTNFCKKKTIFLSRKIHFFQNFRKCFVVFWYRHKCLNCTAVFSEMYFLFWRKLSKIWKIHIFSSYFNRYILRNFHHFV